MSINDEEDKSLFKVVLNHEEQYSIWPVDRENPSGNNELIYEPFDDGWPQYDEDSIVLN